MSNIQESHNKSDMGSDHEKQEVTMLEEVRTSLPRPVALAGHVATDAHGHSIIHIDPAAEARLRWKMDLHIIPVIALLYLFCFSDRANIGNAKLAGLEKDLHMVGYDYNIMLSAFYIAYAVFELPATLLCKKMGPAFFIPLSTVLFGLFALCTGFVQNFGQGVAVRFLLGISEGAVFPGMAYYLSRWYRKDELAFRLSMYVVSAPLAGAFGGLLASGILKINHIGKYHTWRQIFIVEGIITMGLGFAAFFLMADKPENASWLTEEEKALAAARIKSENVGSTVVVDQMSGKAVRDGIFSPTTIVVGLIFMVDNITVQGMGFFLPTVIKTIYPKKTTIQLQLQTVPPYIVGAFFTLLVPFLAWKTKRRALYMVISAPLVMIGYIMFLTVHKPLVKYGATFLIAAGAFSFGALCNAWAAANTTSDSMRAGAIGTVVMFGNLGGLVATWTFLPTDAPNYRHGNSANLGTGTAMLVLASCLWVWQARENRRKEAGHHDHELEGKTTEEIEHLGIRHPGFRYEH
ncbi:MFS general substrate transporter [Meredithblackwellia eburnea MCA 4105]